jgi:tripartite-type tricarboxylate transporter receptor subunit TctC
MGHDSRLAIRPACARPGATHTQQGCIMTLTPPGPAARTRARRLLKACVTLLVAAAPMAHAEEGYPVKPIHFWTPFTTGGTADILGRLLGQRIARDWSQQVIVENRGGAGGTIGMDVARHAPGDGYNFAVISNTVVISELVYPHAPYQTGRDFIPVLFIGSSPMILAASPTRTPLKSVVEIIEYAKQHPDTLTYGECATGSAHHIAMETLKYRTGTDIRHIAYRGCSPSVTDAVAGQIDLVIASSTTVLPQVRSGKLRPIAITADHRSPAAPEIPTVAESGVPALKDFSVDNWYGIVATMGTPQPIVAKMAAELEHILEQPDVREQLGTSGIDVRPGPAAALTAAINGDLKQFRTIIEFAHIHPE